MRLQGPPLASCLTSRRAPAFAPAPCPPPHAGNLYGANVNQQLIMDIMTGMVDKSRTVDGVPTSLKDLGYSDVGLDVRLLLP